MKFKRPVILLTVVVMMGLLLGASAAQAFTVEVDGTGTNATAILNLEFNGVLYDVTFQAASIKDIWGDEAFDFDQPNVAGDASVAVNDALNTEPGVVTVANSSGTYFIPFARAGIFAEVSSNNFVDGTGLWKYGGSFLNTAAQESTYAEFTEAGSIAPAPVPKTGQTESVLPGDDGDLQKGVTWPDPRFTDNGDGTVTDNLTGLMWLTNASCLALDNQPWSSALEASNNLADGQCGLADGSSPGDWRLPNIKELLSLIDYGNADPALPTGHPFTGVQAGWYWTGTIISTDVGVDAVWIVAVSYGVVQATFTTSGAEVWPVRGGND